MPPALGAQSLNHWTAREVPAFGLLSLICMKIYCVNGVYGECERQRLVGGGGRRTNIVLTLTTETHANACCIFFLFLGSVYYSILTQLSR